MLSEDVSCQARKLPSGRLLQHVPVVVHQQGIKLFE